MNNLNDEYNPKGVVRIYVNDELVSVNYNMIVKTGRLFLLDKIYNVANLANSDENTESNYSEHQFYKAYLGKTRANNLATTLDMTLSNIKNVSGSGEDENVAFEASLVDSSNTTITVNRDDRSIKFLFDVRIEPATQGHIGEIYLTIAKNVNQTGDKDETLFSRVVIDPLFLDASETQKIEYCIYF